MQCLACNHTEDQHDERLGHCVVPGCGCTQFLDENEIEDEGVEELNFDEED